MARIKKRVELFCEKELKDHPGGAAKVKSIEVCEGFPAEIILGKADELNCDVILQKSIERFLGIFFGEILTQLYA